MRWHQEIMPGRVGGVCYEYEIITRLSMFNLYNNNTVLLRKRATTYIFHRR